MGAVTVCAVLPTPGVESTQQAADLLETKLAGQEGITLVNRTDFEKLVTEQVLSTAFAADGVKSRIELGKMLKADLLVFLRERKSKSEEKEQTAVKAVELAVADTKRGLRLVSTTQLWHPDKAQTTISTLEQAVLQARTLTERPDLMVFAVPAFECQDVMPDYAGYRSGLAHLVEELLIGTPGSVVVELSEADALSREVAIGGETLARVLPFYLIGTYQSKRTDHDVTFEFAVEMRHGPHTSARSVRTGILEKQLVDALQEVIGELLPKAITGESPTLPKKLESTILLDRAEVFRSLAEWDEAIPLYESALLLEPDNEKAHFRLFEGYALLARSGGKHVTTWPSYDPAGRLRYGAIALRHASSLLRLGHLSREFLGQMPYFRGMFGISEFRWDPKYDQLRQEYRRILVPFGDDCLTLLNNSEVTSGLSQRDRSYVVRQLAWCENWVEDELPIEQCHDRRHKLLILVERLEVSNQDLLKYASSTPVGEPAISSYKRFIKRLEEIPTLRLRQVAHLCKLADGAIDQMHFEKAIKEIERYIADEGLDAALATEAKSLAHEKMRYMEAKARRSQANEGTTTTAKQDDGPPVRLVPISDQWKLIHPDGTRIDRTPRVWSWLTCRPGLEVIVLSNGLYRLGENNELIQIAPVRLPPYLTLQLDHNWDGKYLWIQTSRPRDAIAVVDPDYGEVARFDEHEVIQDGAVSAGRLVCFGPGEAFFFGCLRKAPDPVRTWAMLLKVEGDGNTPPVRRFERIYEAREKLGQTDLDAASAPCWAMRVPKEMEPTGPWVMVRTEGTPVPLIFDIEGKKVRGAKANWSCARPIYVNKSFIVPDGRIDFESQESILMVSNHPDHPANKLLDWGKRPIQAPFSASGFFESAIMFQSRLHLLARYDAPGSPAWIAVDPSTRDTRIVIDAYPNDLPRPALVQLCVSERYGIIFICNGKAYRVEMPPIDQLPVLKTEIKEKPRAAETK